MLPADVKRLNEWNVNDVSNDDALLFLIDQYRGVAEEYCANEFSAPFPHGVQKFIADCIKYNGTEYLQAYSMGSVSETFKTDMPKQLYKSLKHHRKMVW